MRFPGFLLATAVATTISVQGGDNVGNEPAPTVEPPAAQSLRLKPPEPPSADIDVGDAAPNFSFQTEDNRWRRLRELLLQNPVVIVFGADDAELRALDRQRDALLKLGVLPVAVLDVRNGSAWSAAHRLALRYPVIPDPRRVIAGQFNTLDPDDQSTLPAWFVIDRRGLVRAVRRGAISVERFPRLVAGALGLPAPDASLPTHSR
jgi:alkyl hydroperoxide reductase subunit AhpC